MLNVAVHQPTFLPWVGFFNKMMQSDVLILLGGVDFDKTDYMNRCKVNDAWVTLPRSKGKGERLTIDKVTYEDDRLIKKSLKTITQTLGQKPYGYRQNVEPITRRLSKITAGCSLLYTNVELIQMMAWTTRIDTKIIVDMTPSNTPESKTQRLMGIIGRNVPGPVRYYAGPAGKNYLDAADVPGDYEIMMPELRPDLPNQSFLFDLASKEYPRGYAANCATWTNFKG